MGFGFRKSFKVAPGIRINTGKRGASMSVGGKGLTANVSKKGVRTTASLPGTGLSYTTSSKKGTRRKSGKPEVEVAAPEEKASFFETLIGLVIIGVVAYFVLTWIF